MRKTLDFWTTDVGGVSSHAVSLGQIGRFNLFWVGQSGDSGAISRGVSSATGQTILPRVWRVCGVVLAGLPSVKVLRPGQCFSQISFQLIFRRFSDEPE